MFKKGEKSMRKKNDTLIKYFQLANTMYLTNEEFGILIRKVMLNDDTTGTRYENLDAESTADLKAIEKEWTEDYIRIRKNNPMIAQAFSGLSIQVNNSTKSYNLLRERLNKDDDDDKEKTEVTPVIVVNVPDAPEEEIESEPDFIYVGDDVQFTDDAISNIYAAGETVDGVKRYLLNHRDIYNIPFATSDINEVLNELMNGDY